MPIQPTQADLDDYERRMELMRQKKPVYWGPDANAYSYERHVREEQEAQRRREIEFRRQQEEKRARALAQQQQQRSGEMEFRRQQEEKRALAQQQQQRSGEMEAALAERLGMPAPARPDTTPEEEAAYQERQHITREGDPIMWGPQTPDYARHVQDEQNAQALRELEFSRQQRQRIGSDVPGQQERHRENLSQFDGQSAEQSGNDGLMSVPSDPAASARERYERMSPYDKWIHRMKYGEPGVAPPAPPRQSVELDLPDPIRFLQETPDEMARRRRSLLQDGPTVPPPDNYGAAFEEPSVDRRGNLPGGPASPPGSDRRGNLPDGPVSPPGSDQRVSTSGPASQPSRLRAMQNRDPAFEALVGQRDRLRNETRVDATGDSDVTRRFQQSMADQPEPTWKSPEEKMEDTHTAMQRALSGRNTEAREARRGYRPPSEDVINERIAQGLRQRLTGQVDELSNADGRLGAMQAANDRTRAKEQDELAANLAGFRQMRAMLDARAEEAKEAGLPNPVGAGISTRRVPGTDNGYGKEQTAGGMRRQFIREREDARRNAVNEARSAAQTGKDYKYTPTGNDKINAYAKGAASNVNSREITRQAMLRDQLLARDDATGGKLGIRKAMQDQAAEEQRLNNGLRAQEKANEFVSAQNELDRQNELEKARIAAGARGGNEPNVTAIRSAMDAASVTLMKPDATPGEVAEAKRIISEGQRALNGAAGIPNAPPAQSATVDQQRKDAQRSQNEAEARRASTPEQSAEALARSVRQGLISPEEAYSQARKEFGMETFRALQRALEPEQSLVDRMIGDGPALGSQPQDEFIMWQGGQ